MKLGFDASTAKLENYLAYAAETAITASAHVLMTAKNLSCFMSFSNSFGICRPLVAAQ